jgi:AraC-like DNA-binding protein
MRHDPRPVPTPAAPPRLSVATARNIGPSLSRELASVALLGLHIEQPLDCASPPRDVYLMTVLCDDGLGFSNQDWGGSPQMVLSVLRSRPEPFRMSGSGQMVVALVTPLGFLKAFGLPLRGMTDQRIEVQDLVGRAEAALLRDRIMAARGTARADALAQWIEDRVQRRRHLEASASRVAEAVMNTQAPDVRTHVAGLASSVGLQRRQLERDFRFWLGMSPGAFTRLIRFQRAATHIHAGNGIAQVTYDQGFTDQPHLSRVLRRMSSATPREIGRQGRDLAHRLLREACAERLLVVERGR